MMEVPFGYKLADKNDNKEKVALANDLKSAIRLILKNKLPHQNLWVALGSGNFPSA